MKRWMYVTDSHGDLICPRARDAALAFAKKFKPEIRIHGGDAFDFRALRNGASEEERQEGITDDLEAGLAFLNDYKPTVFLWGNHDDRIVQKAAKCADGNLREFCRLIHDRIMDTLGALGCEVRPYDVEDGRYVLGDYKLIHGYNHDMHSAHKAGSVYGNCIMGHVHTFQQAKPLRDDAPTSYTCGSLMDAKRASYARRRLNTMVWENGWMYGWITDDNKLIVQSVRQVAGRWMIPTGFKEIA